MTFCEPSVFSVTLIGILNKFLRIPGNPFPYKQTGVEFWHGIFIYPSRIGGLHKCDTYYWSNKRIPSSAHLYCRMREMNHTFLPLPLKIEILSPCKTKSIYPFPFPKEKILSRQITI